MGLPGTTAQDDARQRAHLVRSLPVSLVELLLLLFPSSDRLRFVDRLWAYAVAGVIEVKGSATGATWAPALLQRNSALQWNRPVAGSL